MRTDRHFQMVLLIAASFAIGSAAQAQEPVQIRDARDACACRVHIERVSRIGDQEGGGIFGRGGPSARDSRGWHFVVDQQKWTRVLVYDEQGRFRRRLGREGGAPGEFRAIHALMIGPGDTLHVIDRGQRRRTTFSPAPSFQLVETRSWPISEIDGLVQLPGGAVAVGGRMPTPQRAVLPIHIVDREGAIVRSFGAHPPPSRSDPPDLARRVITGSRAGGIWSAHKTRYQVELWDTLGELQRTLVRKADWFEPHERVGGVSRERPPRPQIISLEEDGDGRLWVVTLVPDRSWRDALVQKPHPQTGAPRWGLSNGDAYWDAIIEVIDPERAELLASARFPRYRLYFIGNDLAINLLETEDEGLPFVDFLRMRLMMGDGPSP